MKDLVIELLKLGAVGLIAGLFSSALGIRDRRRRIWWEMKVTAYRTAIEALSDLVHYYDVHYSAAIEYRDLPEESQARLKSYWEAASPAVRKFADSGAFLFSEEANAALRLFMQRDDEDSYVEHLDTALHKARNCLKTLVECSKRDLQLPRRWYGRFI